MPDSIELSFKWRDLECCVTLIGSFLAWFRVNLWFFLLCCYITVPSLTDRYYRHTLAASLQQTTTRRHTQKLTGLVSTLTQVEWENAQPKMRLQLQKCFNCVVLQDEPDFKDILREYLSYFQFSVIYCWTTGCMKGLCFYGLICIFKTDELSRLPLFAASKGNLLPNSRKYKRPRSSACE